MSKTALITGATAGFGAATARLFVRHGWKVVATGRRSDRLDELVRELGEENLFPAVFDIRDEKAMKEVLASLPSEFSEIDLLINNAGLALGTKPAPDIQLDDWRVMIDTNVTALAIITQHLLPKLIERQGMIINLSSVAAHWPYPGGNCYGGTKAFVRQFSYGLRCDLHGTGVRVTSIEPGLCESEFTLVRAKGDQKVYDETYKGAKALQPEDIAETLFWVASQPAHVNMNSIELMPVSQTWNPFRIYRG